MMSNCSGRITSLHAGVVYDLVVGCNLRIAPRHVVETFEKETVGQFHDAGFVPAVAFLDLPHQLLPPRCSRSFLLADSCRRPIALRHATLPASLYWLRCPASIRFPARLRTIIKRCLS